jgi:hypothetical protein
MCLTEVKILDLLNQASTAQHWMLSILSTCSLFPWNHRPMDTESTIYSDFLQDSLALSCSFTDKGQWDNRCSQGDRKQAATAGREKET